MTKKTTAELRKEKLELENAKLKGDIVLTILKIIGWVLFFYLLPGNFGLSQSLYRIPY